MTEVVLYSKPGCCLCEEVKTKLARLRGIYHFNLLEVNIQSDPVVLAQFREEIPVVFIDGRKAFKFHMQEGDFIDQLEGLRKKERKNANAT